MLMHSCCSISFIVLSGFDPKVKRIQKSFENESRKLIWKVNYFSSPLPSSFLACWPGFPRWPTRPPSLLPFLFSCWAGPTQQGNRCRTPHSSLSLTARVHPSAPSPTSRVSRGHGATVARALLALWERLPLCPGLYKGGPYPIVTPPAAVLLA